MFFVHFSFPFSSSSFFNVVWPFKTQFEKPCPWLKVHWRRKWQPTPVFLPRESQGQGSLVGCGLWGHTESDTTEATQQQQQQQQHSCMSHWNLSPALVSLAGLGYCEPNWSKAWARRRAFPHYSDPGSTRPGRLQSMGSLRVGHN